jgi:hypothetical protein
MPPSGFFLLVIIIALPVTWLVSEFRGGRALRISLGALALGIGVFCSWSLSSVLTKYSYNARYGSATGDLIKTSLQQIEDGHLERVLTVWRGLNQQYQPTYENRARYQELVEEATRRMRGDVPIETGSSWDVSAFNTETWTGHWDDGYGYWIVINDVGQPFDIVQSGQPRAAVHSVSVSPDFTVLKFKEGEQWLHTLTLKNKYEASYEWFDLKAGKVWETRPIYKLIGASEEQKRMTQRNEGATGDLPVQSNTNRASIGDSPR